MLIVLWVRCSERAQNEQLTSALTSGASAGEAGMFSLGLLCPGPWFILQSWTLQFFSTWYLPGSMYKMPPLLIHLAPGPRYQKQRGTGCTSISQSPPHLSSAPSLPPCGYQFGLPYNMAVPGCCVLSCSVMSNSLHPHVLQPAKILCPWEFSRQGCWSGLPCPPPGDLPNPGIKPKQSDFFYGDRLPLNKHSKGTQWTP